MNDTDINMMTFATLRRWLAQTRDAGRVRALVLALAKLEMIMQDREGARGDA